MFSSSPNTYLTREDLQHFGDFSSTFHLWELEEETGHTVAVVFVLWLSVLPGHVLIEQPQQEHLTYKPNFEVRETLTNGLISHIQNFKLGLATNTAAVLFVVYAINV